MKVRKGMASVAAAVLALGSAVYAGDTASDAASSVSLSTPIAADATAMKPLQAQMDKMGIKLPFQISGFVEGGYMYDTSSPQSGYAGSGSNLQNFNHFSNRLIVDQAEIMLTRAVAADGTKFDWGFTVEGGWGADFAQIHSHGIADHELPKDGAGAPAGDTAGFNGPDSQYDLTQAYVTLNLPIAAGVIVNAGKFVTPMGYEVINPTGNALYSHSYLFADAIPFTQTGITAQVALNSSWSIMAGITRGWDQSSKDNNGCPDFIGQVGWTIDANNNAALTVSEGPQATKDNGDYWTVVDLVFHHTVSDQLSLGFNGDYGDAPHGRGFGAKNSAQWYGAAIYATYNLDPNKMFQLNARGEWFEDNDGFRVSGVPNDYYEATVGLSITPLPNDPILQNMKIRPEVRYDYANRRVFGNGPTLDRNQFTAAVDAILAF